MLVDIEQFLTDDVIGVLFAALFAATLVTGLLAWNQRRAERYLQRRRLLVADKTVMAVQTPLTWYRFTLLAILLPALFGVPYVTGFVYALPLIVDRIRRRGRPGGAEPTPPYGSTRKLFNTTALCVVVSAAGAGYLAGVVRGPIATIACWYAALAVGGFVIAEVSARVRYPTPEPSDVPMSVVAIVDRRVRWPAIGGGLYVALLGAGKTADTAADSLTAEWGWQAGAIDVLRLANTALATVAVLVLVVTAFVVPAGDGARD